MKRWLALTHAPSPRMNEAIRTHAKHEEIDVALAEKQHEEYRRALAWAGAEVKVLDTNREHPDACFIEDTALVLDEIAIVTSMGAPSRKDEPAGIEPELVRHRSIARMAAPALLEGGDVVRVGKKIFVGETARTNKAGIRVLTAIVGPYGYDVIAFPVTRCLHLKSACTALPDGSLLVNPAWANIPDVPCVTVDESEPGAANVVVIGENAIMSAAYPKTAEKVAKHAEKLQRVELTEFAKADGCATCLSIVLTI